MAAEAHALAGCRASAESGGLRVTLATSAPQLLEWTRRYCWPSYAFEGAHDRGEPIVVVAAASAQHARARAALAGSSGDETVTYEGTPARRHRLGPSCTAIAYRQRPGVTLVDHDAMRVTFITEEGDPDAPFEAVRILRAVFTRLLEGAGWTVLHAGAVERNGRCCVVCGPKGAGKTTLVCALAECAGAAFVANDRVYVTHGGARPRLLAWPMSTRVDVGTCLASDALRGWLGGDPQLAYPQAAWEGDREAGGAARWLQRATTAPAPKLDLLTEELVGALGARASVGGEVGSVVLARRRPSGPPQLRRVRDRSRAVAQLAAELLVDDHAYPDWLGLRRAGAQQLRAHAHAVARELAERASVHEVGFSDGASAAVAVAEQIIGR